MEVDKDSLSAKLHQWSQKLASFEDESLEYVMSSRLLEYVVKHYP